MGCAQNVDMSNLHRMACSASVQSAMDGPSISEKGLMRLAAPHTARDILEDLKILPQLRGMRLITPGISFALDSGNAPTTIQELLNNVQKLDGGYTEDDVLQLYLRSRDRTMREQDKEEAARIHAALPAFYKHFHRSIAQLTLQLSNNAQECLRAGISIQDVEDAWDKSLQEMNYSFLPPLAA